MALYPYFERQEGSLCAQHALNALMQESMFTAIDLAESEWPFIMFYLFGSSFTHTNSLFPVPTAELCFNAADMLAAVPVYRRGIATFQI